MKIEESQMRKVYYAKKFDGIFEINNDTQLIINENLRVYALIDGDEYIQKNVDFDIYRDNNGTLFIHPNFPSEECEEFMIVGERLAMCKIIEIKASDYISKIEHDGCYSFVIEDE